MKREKVDKEMKYPIRFTLRFVIGLVVNLIFLGTLNIEYLKQLYQPFISDLANDMNRFDMFFTQTSVSFIIISLVSVLSTTTKIVYWEDISQYKLVKPKYTSFIDFAAYILSCLTISTVCLLVKSNMIFVPFLISIVLLALLTVKMIGSYFARDSVREELRDIIIQSKDSDYDKYVERKSRLIENTYKEIDSKDYRLIEENTDLLIECKEYGSCIYILDYIGELLPDLFCKLIEKYDGILKNTNRRISDKYYQLLSSNTIRFINNGRLAIFATKAFKLYLNGRINQILNAVEAYNGSIQKEPRKKMVFYRQCLDLDRYSLGKIYAACIKNDNFELLNEFLSTYNEQLKMIFDCAINNYYDTDQHFAERLKQIYIVDFEIKKVVSDLVKKINAGGIDGRQINIVLRTLIDIYCCIEKNETEEVGKAHKAMFDELSYVALKDCFKELIEATADAGILTAWTYESKRVRGSEYIRELLKSVSTKVIDTV